MGRQEQAAQKTTGKSVSIGPSWRGKSRWLPRAERFGHRALAEPLSSTSIEGFFIRRTFRRDGQFNVPDRGALHGARQAVRRTGMEKTAVD